MDENGNKLSKTCVMYPETSLFCFLRFKLKLLHVHDSQSHEPLNTSPCTCHSSTYSRVLLSPLRDIVTFREYKKRAKAAQVAKDKAMKKVHAC